MCTPELLNQWGTGTAKIAPGSLGKRIDVAQNLAQATAGGGTAVYSQSILNGLPRTTDADAIRKTTILGV